jgi:arsenate reductase (glutaredoxin)
MSPVVIYHNPNCSNSRRALELLRERHVDLDVVQYLKTPLDGEALASLLDQLVDPPAELVRHDKRFKELGLDAGAYDEREAVLELLVRHPELMQRPVVVHAGRAVIARPPDDKLSELLG